MINTAIAPHSYAHLSGQASSSAGTFHQHLLKKLTTRNASVWSDQHFL